MNGDPKLKVEHVINSLKNMQEWCGVLIKALEGLGREQEFTVPQDLHEDVLKGPRQGGGCGP